jgi:membrane peptidoglycan carboxypeptidase
MVVREKGDRGVAQAVALFLGVSLLAGVLAAGLAIPFAGLAGFGTKKTSETFEQLPQELQVQPLPVRSRIVDANNKTIAFLYYENRIQVPLSKISPIMRKAIIAIEDDRFYQHGALDAKGTMRALIRNKSDGSTTQGGSSITQQYVKMVLLQQAKTPAEQKAATEESYERKLRELRYAVALEKKLTKDQILERYLNIANFGDGAFGVEAAARHYWRGATAQKLTLAQAATLAGIVKNPSRYDPTNDDGKPGKARRDLVLNRMLQLNLITAKQAADAKKQPVIDPDQVVPVRNGCANSIYPFFCEYVVAKLLENPVLGRTRAQREKTLKGGGVVVKTSLDPKVQRALQVAVDQHSNPTDDVIAAMTAVEPGTGLVKGMAQSRPYGGDKSKGRTVFNYNTERSYPGGFGGFQNGSTMKAFTLAAAIQKGVSLNYRINSPQTLNLSGKKFATCKGYTSAPDYTPKNSTKGGNLTLVEATENSTNTYYLQLSQRIGLCPISTLATQLGVVNGKDEWAYDTKTKKAKLVEKRGDPIITVPSYTLGIGSVTPLMIANAYATFAARGKYCEPQVVTGIFDKSGRQIANPQPDCKQVMKPVHADLVNQVLQSVVRNGTGRPAQIGRPAAGKTGTINANKAVWFAGYTPNLAAAATVADADAPFQDMMRANLKLNGKPLYDVTGGRTAGGIWKDGMKGALDGVAEQSFPKPDPNAAKGVMMSLPALGGMDPVEAANILRSAGFLPAIASERVRSEYPEGKVAYTDPRRRDGAPSGSLVTIYVSNGQPIEKPKPPQPTKPPTTKPTSKPTITIPTQKPCPPWRPNCNR